MIKPVNEIVCHCMNITASDIRGAVQTGRHGSMREVSRCTGAGAGCTACRGRIRRMIAETRDQPSLAEPICSAR